MVKLKIDIEMENRKMIIAELEHILFLVIQDYPSGTGWTLEGKDEKEFPVIEVEDDGEIDLLDIPF